MEINKDDVVCYGKVIIHQKNHSINVSIGLGDTKFTYHSIPITLRYKYIYFDLEAINCKFDRYSYKNTPSYARNNKLVVTNISELGNLQEITSSKGIKLGSKDSDASYKNEQKTQKSKKKSSSTTREIDDLRIELNKGNDRNPSWQIKQVNDSSLILEPSYSVYVASLKYEPNKIVRISGSLRTDRDGYTISTNQLKLHEKFNPKLRFKLRLFLRGISKIIQNDKVSLHEYYVAQTNL